MMDNNDIEVGDVENFHSEKNQQFSHQSLVMMAFRKVVEAGCREMILGHNQLLETGKGTKIIHVPDQRKEYVNSIKNLKAIMICDFDEDAKNNIKKLLEKNKEKEEGKSLEEIKTKLLKLQQDDWDNLIKSSKDSVLNKTGYYIKGYFNSSFPYGEMFLQEQVEIYRKVFEELTLLTKRADFYKTEEFEG